MQRHGAFGRVLLLVLGRVPEQVTRTCRDTRRSASQGSAVLQYMLRLLPSFPYQAGAILTIHGSILIKWQSWALRTRCRPRTLRKVFRKAFGSRRGAAAPVMPLANPFTQPFAKPFAKCFAKCFAKRPTRVRGLHV